MQSERSFSFWNRFWFQPTSPAPVCVLRVLYGALVLSCCLLWAPDLLTYFGPDGLVSLQTIQHYEGSQRFSLLFLLPQTDASVFFVFLLLVCSAVTVSVGLYTRISLITLFLCLVSLHHRNVAILNSGDTLLRIIGFLLIFSPCGQMFSIDRKRSRDLTDHWKLRTACWTQRLLQLQVSAVYCQAFASKADSDVWWNGTAVYYTSRLEDFARLPVPFVFDHLWTCQLLTWGAMVIELSLWTLIWFKEFRYWVLAAGVLLHLGIDWSMNIPLFEYIMIASYIVFIDASDIKRALEALKECASKSLGSPTPGQPCSPRRFAIRRSTTDLLLALSSWHKTRVENCRLIESLSCGREQFPPRRCPVAHRLLCCRHCR